MLTIGGIDPKPMYETIRRGVHAVVATPGRLKVGGVLTRSDPTWGVRLWSFGAGPCTPS